MAELLSLGLAILSLAFIVPKVTKEKHYVLRDSSVENDLVLLANGFVTIFTSSNMPILFAAGIIVGVVGIIAALATSQRQAYGTKLGSGIVTLVLLLGLVILQLNSLGYVSLF